VNPRYGSPDVIEVREVPKPEPRAGDVLVKVHATTVSRTDCGQLRAHPFFMRLITGVARPNAPSWDGFRRGGRGDRRAGHLVRPRDRVFGLTPGATVATPSTCVSHRKRRSR